MKTLTIAAMALATPALAQNPATVGEPALEGIAPQVTLRVVTSDRYGDYVAVEDARGEHGRPVYVFSTDTPAKDGQEARITCADAKCLQDWTPVNGEVVLGEGLQSGPLGSVTYQPVEGEELQIALWGGWPLYTYELDEVPMTDEPQGQGDVSFGGTWYLISPEGEPIEP